MRVRSDLELSMLSVRFFYGNTLMSLVWSVISLYVMQKRGASFWSSKYRTYAQSYSKKLVANLLKPHLVVGDISLKESTVLSMISKAKARGFDAATMSTECNENKSSFPSIIDKINSIASSVYTSYERSLRQTNSLDFDDLLLFGVKLFRCHEKAVEWCKHVLVDELCV